MYALYHTQIVTTCHQRPPPFYISVAIFFPSHSCCEAVHTVVKVISVRLAPVSSEIVKHSELVTPCRSYDDVCAVHRVEANCVCMCVCVCVLMHVCMLCAKQSHAHPYEFRYQFLAYPRECSYCLSQQADYRTSQHPQPQESLMHVAKAGLTLW